jgi:hypothetical protein
MHAELHVQVHNLNKLGVQSNQDSGIAPGLFYFYQAIIEKYYKYFLDYLFIGFPDCYWLKVSLLTCQLIDKMMLLKIPIKICYIEGTLSSCTCIIANESTILPPFTIIIPSSAFETSHTETVTRLQVQMHCRLLCALN